MNYIFWKDIDIWFRKNSAGDILVQENNSAILNSIYNILTTCPGDRRMLPTFACNLRGLLFEPMDSETENKISSVILGALETWEPRIYVNSVNTKGDYTNLTYDIEIDFTILKNSEDIKLNFPVKKI